MLKRYLLFIALLVAAPSLALAENKDLPKADAHVAVASELLEDNMGVIVVETSRESQPVFNLMDIIVSYNDVAIKDTMHLESLFNEQPAKDKHKLAIIRDKKLLKFEVSSGPWHVALHDMTQEAYATLITDQNSNTLNKDEQTRQLGMLQQYLKGRPYRTPNNQGTRRNEKTERHSDGKPKDK